MIAAIKTSLTSIFLQLRALWAALRSYFKRDWQLEDYPLVLINQEKVLSESGIKAPAGVQASRWIAVIINWWHMDGQGDTPEAAREDLRQKLDAEFRQAGSLPRPGSGRPPQVASSAEIEAYRDLAQEFLVRIFGLHPGTTFLSDRSSLDDFTFFSEIDETQMRRRITLIYGVDIRDIEDGNLLRIFERIRRKQGEKASGASKT